MTTKLQSVLDMIYALLLECEEASLLHEDAERLVDLCRYVNRYLKNEYFGLLIDDIEEYLRRGFGISESDWMVHFDNENIPNKIRSFCRELEYQINKIDKSVHI